MKKKAASIELRDSPPPKAEPNRIIIRRTLTSPDMSEHRTIDLIEQVKPGLLRTYRETRHFGPEKLPGDVPPENVT